MELIWICYDFVMAVFMALILGWRTVMVSLWLETGRGMAQGLEWKRSGRLARATVSPTLDSLRCKFCCLTQKLNLSIRRENS